jgi:alkylated DNA repair dioxygenase AlkB
MRAQKTLFDDAPGEPAALPPGFRYQADLISEAEEQELAAALAKLPLKPFEFQGHLGNRRVVSFGLRYDYWRREVHAAATPPDWLAELTNKIAQFSGHSVEAFQQFGVNEYRPGAGIGWHRDKPEFGDVCGLSLLSAAKMRFRKKSGAGWLRKSRLLEPRSVYILSGEVRKLWEHSILPVHSLRYSLTFRTLARTEESNPSS